MQPTLRYVSLAVLAAIVLAACGGARPGSAIATIGVVNATPMRDEVVSEFRAAMAELGYVEGRNIRFLYSGALSDRDDRDRWAQWLVAENVHVILAVTTPGAQSAARATASLPIVFVPVTDPVGAGLVNSLQSPGGNITGVTNGNPHPVRLQLLAELDSSIRRVYVPLNPDSMPVRSSINSVREAAEKLNIELVEHELRTDAQIVQAIEALPADVDAVFLAPDPTIAAYSKEWANAAINAGIPISSFSSAEIEDGILLTYGEELPAAARQAARMVEAILAGTPPDQLPVETTEHILSINLATASAIGLDVPDNLLRRAGHLVRS